ncbi:MAG: putative beta-barrel porin 2 [Verrucomicrobiota bacterium]
MSFASHLSLWLAACAGALAVGRAATSPPEPPPLPEWSWSGALEAGAGYRDNLLLSSAAEERSGFLHAAAELLLLRAPGRGLEASVFLQTEGRRFWSGRTVQQEASAWLQAEPAWRPARAWKCSLPVSAYYDDRVFDVSDTDVERLIAETRLRGVLGGPQVRWDFADRWHAEAQIAGDRVRYEDGVNDAAVRRGLFRIGWRPAPAWEAKASVWQRERTYARRVQYSAAGRPLFGTRLQFAETEGEISVGFRWGPAERWRATGRVGGRRLGDNGSDYFGHREARWEQQLEWSDDRWKLRVEAGLRELRFGVQTVGLGIDPPARRRRELSGSLRVERHLAGDWSVMALLSREHVRSNDPLGAYRVNEGLLALRRGWER